MTISEETVLPERELAVRDQGPRPTCLAFVIADMNARFGPGLLSPEYVYQATAQMTPTWSPGKGLQVPIALAASAQGLPEESDFPYQVNEPTLPLQLLPSNLPLYGTPLKCGSSTASSVISALRAGFSVGLGLRLTLDFYSPQSGIIGFSSSVLPGAYHAVLAVGIGYDKSASTSYVLIRNSWGKDWGKQGYAWLPEAYINAHALYMFGIQL